MQSTERFHSFFLVRNYYLLIELFNISLTVSFLFVVLVNSIQSPVLASSHTNMFLPILTTYHLRCVIDLSFRGSGTAAVRSG